MTDLVERLGRGCNCGKCKMDLCCCHTMEEAKDCIKALKAEIARKDEALALCAKHVDWMPHPHSVAVEAAIRAALESKS